MCLNVFESGLWGSNQCCLIRFGVNRVTDWSSLMLSHSGLWMVGVFCPLQQLLKSHPLLCLPLIFLFLLGVPLDFIILLIFRISMTSSSSSSMVFSFSSFSCLAVTFSITHPIQHLLVSYSFLFLHHFSFTTTMSFEIKPKSFSQTIKHLKWHEAMVAAEIKAFKQNNTRFFTPLSNGKKKKKT